MQVFFDNPAKIRIFTKENRLTLQKLGESVAKIVVFGESIILIIVIIPTAAFSACDAADLNKA